MHTKLKFFKRGKLHFPLKRTDAQHYRAELSSRKKVIMPISSEADIRAASALHKPKYRVVTVHVAKMLANARHTAPGTNKHAHLVPGPVAKADASMKVELLSSGLKRKNHRSRKFFAFLAQLLLWATAYYILFL